MRSSAFDPVDRAAAALAGPFEFIERKGLAYAQCSPATICSGPKHDGAAGKNGIQELRLQKRMIEDPGITAKIRLSFHFGFRVERIDSKFLAFPDGRGWPFCDELNEIFGKNSHRKGANEFQLWE